MVVKYAKQFTCPKCEWTIEAPADKENILQHFMLHAEKEHPGMEWSKAKVQSQMKDFYYAKKIKCPDCDWYLIDPGDSENLTKHLMVHLKEFHPEKEWTEEDFQQYIKEVKVENKRQ
jgi:predicted small metal-binding protein